MSRIGSMKTLPYKIVAEAFALSNSRGAELLARLGEYDVWRGDLATMRLDSPRASESSDTSEGQVRTQQTTVVFLDTLLLARAIELLPPICRAALAAVYADRQDIAALATELDTQPADAQRITANCEKRLLETYDSLTTSAVDEGTVPHWVSEREHAAVGGNRQR
jgi:hypothetical protein